MEPDSNTLLRPESFSQWQVACATIKSLYLQGMLLACIAQASDLLKSPKIHLVHKAFMNFYAGLAHETLTERTDAESLNNADFHAHLNAAEHHLSAALGCLPVLGTRQTGSHSESRDGGYEALRRNIFNQQRSSSESSRPGTELSRRDSKSSRTTITTGAQEHVQDDDTVAGARGRYNRLLLSLKPELEAHFTYIQILRQDSSEALTRSSSRTGGSRDLQDTLAKFAVNPRVADGRKRNWKRERFSLTPISSEE